MCNGYRHDRERCTCGFGGEGHLGHRGGARETCIGFDPPETQRSTRWHNKPMAQLAAELGHSVIFPVACRGCGHRIYLFADPNGGFAMFDEVNPPWPKHVCPRNFGEATRYNLPPTRYSPRYDMPVPLDTLFADYKSGQRLSGAVVDIRPERLPHRSKEIFNVILYNGFSLFKFCTQETLRVSDFVTGTAVFSPGIGTCLADIEQVGKAMSAVEALKLSKELEDRRLRESASVLRRRQNSKR